jgi:hypothetical protein
MDRSITRMTVLIVTLDYHTANLTTDCLRSLRDETHLSSAYASSQEEPTRRSHYEQSYLCGSNRS